MVVGGPVSWSCYYSWLSLDYFLFSTGSEARIRKVFPSDAYSSRTPSPAGGGIYLAGARPILCR